MRMLFRGGLALALCLGLAMTPGWAQNPSPTGDDLTTIGATDPLYRAWAGKSAAYRLAQQKQLQMEREAREKEAKANPAGGPATTPTPPIKSLAEERIKEQNAYFRRVEVCDRLRQVAVQNNDTGLLKQVEQLETEAFELYQKRTGIVATKLLQDDVPTDAKAGPKSAETGMILPPTPRKTTPRTEGKP